MRPKLLLMTNIGSCICALNWRQDRWPWTAASSNFRRISRDFADLGGNNSYSNEDRSALTAVTH